LRPEEVIPKLGYPPRIAAQLTVAVRTGKFKRKMISAGEIYFGMCFGNGKIVQDVIAVFDKGHTEGANSYEVEENGIIYTLDVPDVCGNAARTPERLVEPLAPPKQEDAPPRNTPQPKVEIPFIWGGMCNCYERDTSWWMRSPRDAYYDNYPGN
jgi:hypothetical protein